MAISKIGMIIRRRRTELGLSQEDLADGICAVTTLSRIENGERMPTQNHLEMLLQRVGYSDMMLESYVDENAFLAHELKFKIRQASIESDTEKAKEFLSKFEQLLKMPSKIDKQFILFQNAVLYPSRYSEEERLSLLEEAICLTHPKYKQGHTPYLLSYEEILIINNISICLNKSGRAQEAIDMLYAIVNYYDNHVVNSEEALRTEPMTLYNLSKILGMENRYNECIAICEKGILLAQKTGRSTFLAQTLYNKAWAHIKRGRAEDIGEASALAHKALSVAEVFGIKQLSDYCKRLIQDNRL